MGNKHIAWQNWSRHVYLVLLKDYAQLLIKLANELIILETISCFEIIPIYLLETSQKLNTEKLYCTFRKTILCIN